jgi:uncharacterized protein with HEPN domain
VSRDWRLYWDDIIEACEKVLRYTAGMDRHAFDVDEKTRDAVLRNLEIIGEAAKHLPSEARQLAGHIEWKKICGFRDYLTHAYFGVDSDIVWSVVQEKVPELLSALKSADSANPPDAR